MIKRLKRRRKHIWVICLTMHLDNFAGDFEALVICSLGAHHRTRYGERRNRFLAPRLYLDFNVCINGQILIANHANAGGREIHQPCDLPALASRQPIENRADHRDTGKGSPVFSVVIDAARHVDLRLNSKRTIADNRYHAILISTHAYPVLGYRRKYQKIKSNDVLYQHKSTTLHRNTGIIHSHNGIPTEK